MVWFWIVLASLVAFATKLAGYLIPQSLLDSPRFHKASAAMTIGLLAALVASNTFASGAGLGLDARVLALGTAIIALLFRAPFLLVVVLGAAAAALGRLAGLP